MDVRGFLRRYGDLALAGVLMAIFTTEVALWDNADHVKAVPCAVIGAAALALRRKVPLAAFLLAWAGSWGVLYFAPDLDNDSIAFICVFFISLYSLGRYTKGHEIWIGGLAVLGYVVAFIVGDVGRQPDLGDIAFSTLFVGGPWAGGLVIRLRQDRERVLTAHNRELQRDQEVRERKAVAAERARIARELHDVVSHAIAVTVLQARGGRKMIGVDDQAVRRSLDAIEHTNTQALSDMRRLLSLLRDTEGDGRADPQPSLDRLQPLLGRLRGSGLAVDLEVTGDPRQVPPGVDLSAYRIIQEALTNVVKHAGPGARATLRIDYATEQLDIHLLDNGRVPVAADGRGQGLIGIRERVAVVGGRVAVGPEDGGGFAVHASLPYRVQA